MTRRRPSEPVARDRAVRRVRAVSWATGGAAAVLSAVLSVAAAHAFKGHDGRQATHAAPAATPSAPRARVHVPPPDPVPSLSGTPAPPQPPAQPPASVPPPAAPPPVSSGGS